MSEDHIASIGHYGHVDDAHDDMLSGEANRLVGLFAVAATARMVAHRLKETTMTLVRQPGAATSTYATANVVIDLVGATIWAEDLGHDTWPKISNPFLERAGRFVDPKHVRLFLSMTDLTTWLLQEQAVVGKCWFLGAELSDEERQS